MAEFLIFWDHNSKYTTFAESLEREARKFCSQVSGIMFDNYIQTYPGDTPRYRMLRKAIKEAEYVSPEDVYIEPDDWEIGTGPGFPPCDPDPDED